MRVLINGWPVTSEFQSIDAAHKTPHQGVDLGVPVGTPVPSVTDGIVTKVTNEGGQSFGKAVHVHTTDGRDVIYGHLSQQNVHVGQRIHAGDVIGLSGNTGHSTGPHLHIQVMQNGHATDPSQLLVASQPKSIPWWDLEGHVAAAAQQLEDSIVSGFHRFELSIVDSLAVILPTLALVGVIWWMVPFFPKSDKAPKLIGTSLLVYMFYCLARGA